jgi:hypothetical protein
MAEPGTSTRTQLRRRGCWCTGEVESTEPDKATKGETRSQITRIYEAWGKPDKAAEYRALPEKAQEARL